MDDLQWCFGTYEGLHCVAHPSKSRSRRWQSGVGCGGLRPFLLILDQFQTAICDKGDSRIFFANSILQFASSTRFLKATVSTGRGLPESVICQTFALNPTFPHPYLWDRSWSRYQDCVLVGDSCTKRIWHRGWHHLALLLRCFLSFLLWMVKHSTRNCEGILRATRFLTLSSMDKGSRWLLFGLY